MENTNQEAIDLYAPIALDHTRDQYAKAKQNLKNQSAQVIELQERLITKQADEIEAQRLLVRQKGFTILELQQELERAQGLDAVVRDKEYTISELRDELERARGLDEEKDATIIELQEALKRMQSTLIREKDIRIQELQDEVEKLRHVLTSISDATTLMRSKSASQDIQAREEYGDGRGGGNIIQQNTVSHAISRHATAMRVDKELPAMPPVMGHLMADDLDIKLRIPPVVPHKVPRPIAIPKRSQSPTLTQCVQNYLDISDNPDAYTSSRSLLTLSLPTQPLKYPIQSDSPTSPVNHDNIAAKSARYQRYTPPLSSATKIDPPPTPAMISARQGNLPPVPHRRVPSREGGLRSSILSTSLSIPVQRNVPPRALSFTPERPQTARDSTEMDHNEEEEMRKKIRAVAEQRKRAAFGPTDRVERDSTVLTYITTESSTGSETSLRKPHRFRSTIENLGKRSSDSKKKKKTGIQKSEITHLSFSQPSEVTQMRSRFAESLETGTTSGSEFERITGAAVKNPPSPQKGDTPDGAKKNRDIKTTSSVMDRIRGWKDKDKDKDS